MEDLSKVIIRLPEFRDWFDPNEPLTMEKCAQYLATKFVYNSLINTIIDNGVEAYRRLKEE